LYLMTWIDSFRFIVGWTEFQSKTIRLK